MSAHRRPRSRLPGLGSRRCDLVYFAPEEPLAEQDGFYLPLVRHRDDAAVAPRHSRGASRLCFGAASWLKKACYCVLVQVVFVITFFSFFSYVFVGQ